MEEEKQTKKIIPIDELEETEIEIYSGEDIEITVMPVDVGVSENG